MKFTSKIDWWLLLILIVVTVSIISKIYKAHQTDSLASNFSYLAIYSVIIFLIWLPIFNTYYVVDQNKLIIKSMVFRWKINIDDITKIEETHNPLSSPALSLDRLKIYYFKNGSVNSVMISPKDKEGFFQAINKRPY
ncbi:PH domain-containing protein [Acinetobacter sp. AYS6]|uniref:PH domain-containing protein n=1 Tax=Acinetobacter sp. AYS6 TaxID=2983297 RepID=UPI0021D64FD7|nr:PH domain-containing protein [Acinetobacter sp. AYS6]MCU7696081.1 PH domain-containing protein [Acinetobacter sp. AYS6]